MIGGPLSREQLMYEKEKGRGMRVEVSEEDEGWKATACRPTAANFAVSAKTSRDWLARFALVLIFLVVSVLDFPELSRYGSKPSVNSRASKARHKHI